MNWIFHRLCAFTQCFMCLCFNLSILIIVSMLLGLGCALLCISFSSTSTNITMAKSDTFATNLSSSIGGFNIARRFRVLCRNHLRSAAQDVLKIILIYIHREAIPLFDVHTQSRRSSRGFSELKRHDLMHCSITCMHLEATCFYAWCDILISMKFRLIIIKVGKALPVTDVTRWLQESIETKQVLDHSVYRNGSHSHG